MLRKLGKIMYWLSVGLVVANVLVGVVLAALYHTWNPIITGVILATMTWVVSRMLRYIFTGK